MIDPLARRVAGSYVFAIVEAAEACGVPRSRLLDGIPVDIPDDPLQSVDFIAVRLLWERAVGLAGDSHFGLHVGERIKPGAFHVLGSAILNSPTLGEALTLMLDYQHLISNAGVLTLERGGASHIVRYEPQLTSDEVGPHQIEAIFSSLVTGARWLAASGWRPKWVTFAHPMHGDLSEYTRIFTCDVSFDAPEHRIGLTDDIHDVVNPYADVQLLDMHLAYANRLLAATGESTPVSDHARRWLRKAQLATATEEELAAAGHMSVRSLQRALRTEGTSWRLLRDEARHQRAVAFLKGGRLTLGQIAGRLGYSDASSLVRAFRRWEGTSPRRYPGE